jgi:molecular chaperone DnaK (HSP70)
MEHPSAYLVGIDLGTTNSVVAYVDSAEVAGVESSAIRVFPVPQLVAPREVRALPSLPSFLYFPTEDELSAGAVSLPWEEQPSTVAGVMAREEGALTPGRQVASAKSWLSHAAVDRRAKILPREAEPPQAMVSPVEASARYLMHLRNGWNNVMAVDGRGDPGRRFENQEIVLTVPASFDEEARELTVEAAQQAGLKTFTLLEEPLAAFYDWIATHRQSLRNELRDGDLVLICDIGGGTTDFSLVRARVVDGEVQFERTAIGEHLLLGGDNLDLALARRVEEKLGGSRLSLRQRNALRRACCAAKERLLTEAGLGRLPISILGSGRAVVGQMLGTELTRDEVLDVLATGFLPLTAADDLPARGRTAGLRELGLPYAGDPAITKHLAAFLTQAAAAMRSQTGTPLAESRRQMARPDAILFNGGFCAPAIARDRITEAVTEWFTDAGQEWRPKVLHNEAMDNAVAKGAAYYGRVRRGAGLRIRAGSARTYYIGLRSEHQLQGVCVLPAGVDEGTTLPLSDREFAVLANRPVSFTLYSSRLRHDAHGEVVSLEPEQVHRHAPLVTLLRYGKKLRELELAVRLRANFTEMGTLELWCESLNSPHRWRLQFELRGDQTLAQPGEAEPQLPMSRPQPAPSAATSPSLDSAAQLIRTVFGKVSEATGKEAVTPGTLVSQMEAGLGMKRDSWPITAIRPFADVLAEVGEGRKKSPAHEVRWLNLLGFCLRPGFGVARDETQTRQVRNLHMSGPAFPGELQSEVEWLVLWRRVAGGVNASQQQELYRRFAPLLGVGGKKTRGRLNRQIEYEGWRLLASLEHLPATLRASLGNELLTKIRRDPTDKSWLWPLARLGARIPLYGPLSCVVAVDTAEEWLQALLELPEFTPEMAYTIVQLVRRTGDPSRDLGDALRETVIARLRAAGMDEESIECVEKFVPPGRSDAARMFGEPLPQGLQFVNSANCLLSITALTPEPEKVA